MSFLANLNKLDLIHIDIRWVIVLGKVFVNFLDFYKLF